MQPVSAIDKEAIEAIGGGSTTENTVFTRFEDGEYRIWCPDSPDECYATLNPPNHDVTLRLIDGEWMWVEGEKL